jgi:hypothetical protein
MTKVEQDLGVKATYSRENADQKRIKSLQDQVVKLEKENEQLKLEKDVLIGEEESKKYSIINTQYNVIIDVLYGTRSFLILCLFFLIL